MDWNTLLISIGCACGALCRYEVGQFVGRRTQSRFPWATWCVNLAGTACLCVLYQASAAIGRQANDWAICGTAFCGGLTTFSTLSLEAVRLFRTQPGLAMAYLSSSFGLGMILAFIVDWTVVPSSLASISIR